MKAIEKVADIRAKATDDGWLINPDRPDNPYSFTAVHFDAMGAPITLQVFSDMQGRLTVALGIAGHGITLNDRLYEIIDCINVRHRLDGT